MPSFLEICRGFSDGQLRLFPISMFNPVREGYLNLSAGKQIVLLHAMSRFIFFARALLPPRLLLSRFPLFHTTLDLLRLAKSIATLLRPKPARLSFGHVPSLASKARPKHYAMQQVRVTQMQKKKSNEIKKKQQKTNIYIYICIYMNNI